MRQNRKILIIVIFIILIFNCLAIFVVFKNYRSSSQIISEVSKVKLKYSKVKEKFVHLSKFSSDSTHSAEIYTLNSQIAELDSLLEADIYSADVLSSISQKLENIDNEIVMKINVNSSK